MSTRLYVAAIHGSNEQGGIVVAVIEFAQNHDTNYLLYLCLFRRKEKKYLCGFSPIWVAPGQCAIMVIVTPMNIMPIDITSNRMANGLQRGGMDRRCIRATYSTWIILCSSVQLRGRARLCSAASADVIFADCHFTSSKLRLKIDTLHHHSQSNNSNN